jgi:pyridoxamine 5'-phosphate oxidase
MTDNIPANPFTIFNQWLKEAKDHPHIHEPTAMAVATSDNNSPSLRILLAKEMSEKGFTFYTNLTGKKSQEIAHNDNVALCFYWMPIDKQIRITGKARQVHDQEADSYFATRHRGSQIGAWASKQSTALESFEELESRVAKITKDFEGVDIPRPPFWSGFRVIADSIEFWAKGEHRCNKRTLYKKSKDGWVSTYLYP